MGKGKERRDGEFVHGEGIKSRWLKKGIVLHGVTECQGGIWATYINIQHKANSMNYTFIPYMEFLINILELKT